MLFENVDQAYNPGFVNNYPGATRGRKPDWVKEILEAGGDIEQYRVK